MKRALLRFYYIFSILLFSPIQPASIDSLQGSYTNLPKELKPLSLLDGAIAVESAMLRRIYQANPGEGVNKKAIHLVQNLFNLIPNTEHLELSKIIDRETLTPVLINNLIYRYIRYELATVSPFQLTNFGSLFLPVPRKGADYIPPCFFAQGSFESVRLTILGALWFIKHHILDFDYEAQLKTALLSASKNLLAKAERHPTIKAKLIEIHTAAELINKRKTQSTNTNFQHKLDETMYEKVAIKSIKAMHGTEKTPPLLEQVNHAIININGATYDFADCVETLIRNIINLFAYDAITKKTCPKLLRIKFPSARPELIEFYTQYHAFDLKAYPPQDTPEQIKFIDEYNAHSQKTPQAYDDWARLVSNIPGINYCENNHNMNPTWTNLIVIIDYLLGLAWFEPKEYPQQDPIAFAQKYLDKLISLLGISTLEPKSLTSEYGELHIQNDGFTISIKLKDYHGHVSFTADRDTNFKPEADEFALFPSLWLLTPIKNWPEKTHPYHTISLFAHPIDTINGIRELPNQPCSISPHLFHFIKKQINKQVSDQDNGKTISLLKLYRKFITTNNPKSLAQKAEGVIVSQAIKLANSSIKNNSSAVQKTALQLFKALTKKNLAFAEASAAASTGLETINWGVRTEAVELFLTLFAKDTAFDIATQKASTAIENQEPEIRLSSIQLFKLLIEEGKAFKEAKNAAAKGIQDSNKYVRQLALELLIALVEKGKAFNLATKAATTYIESPTEFIRKSAFILFKTLLDNEQAIISAIISAIKNLENPNEEIKKAGLQLFKKLFKKGLGFSEAIKTATDNLQSQDWLARNYSIRLFTLLLEKDHAQKEAIAAASQALQSPNWGIRGNASELFKVLIEKGHGINKAITSLINALHDSPWPMGKSSLLLFEKIVEHLTQELKIDQAEPPAITIALQALENHNKDARAGALRLFSELFKKSKALDEAEIGALKALQHTAPGIRQSALHLLTKLFENNYGLQEIISATTLALQDKNIYVRRSAAQLYAKTAKKLSLLPAT